MNLTGNQKIAVAVSVVLVFGVLLGGSYFSPWQSTQSMDDANSQAAQNTGAAQRTITPGAEVKITEVVQGNGATAQSGSVVSVNYTGTLEDGTKFDSSYDRGEPITFILGQGQVIPGWDYGIQGMKVGGKRELVIPPQYAYGAGGVPGVIPGNATLYFDVELVSVE